MSELNDARRLDEAIAALLTGTPIDRVLAHTDRDLAPYLRAFNQLQALQPPALPPPSEEFRLRLRARFVQGANHETRVARGRGGKFQRAAVAGAASLILGSALNPALAQELVHHVRETMGRAAADVLNAALFIERRADSGSQVPQQYDSESSPPGTGNNEPGGTVAGDSIAGTAGPGPGALDLPGPANQEEESDTQGEVSGQPGGWGEDSPRAVPPHAPGPPDDAPPATANGSATGSADVPNGPPAQPAVAGETPVSSAEGSSSQANKPTLPPIAEENSDNLGSVVETPAGNQDGAAVEPGAPGDAEPGEGPPGLDGGTPPGLDNGAPSGPDGDGPPGQDETPPPGLGGDPPGQGGAVPGNSGNNGNGPPGHTPGGNVPPEHAAAGGQPPAQAVASDGPPGRVQSAANDEPTENPSHGASKGSNSMNSSKPAETPQPNGQGVDKSAAKNGTPTANGDATGNQAKDSAPNGPEDNEPDADEGNGSSGGGAAANSGNPGPKKPKGRTADDDDTGGSGVGPDPDPELEPGSEPRRDLSRVRATNRGTSTIRDSEQPGLSSQESKGLN